MAEHIEQKDQKKIGGKRYTFRGKTLDELLKMNKVKLKFNLKKQKTLSHILKGEGDKLVSPELCELFESKVRRRVSGGLGHRYNKLLDKIRKSKKATLPGEKPAPVKTHYRSMIVRIFKSFI